MIGDVVLEIGKNVEEFDPKAERVSYNTFIFPFRWVKEASRKQEDGKKKCAHGQGS